MSRPAPARRAAPVRRLRPALAALGLLAAIAAPPASAQGAAPFSRMGMGARSVALPAQVADLSGYASPYLNPALAPFQPSQAVEFSAGLLSFDREWQAVQVGSPLQPQSGFASGVVHGGVSNIDGRDASGRPLDAPTADGTYAADEYAFFVAFGVRFSDAVSGGLGLRLYRSEILQDVRPPTAIGLSAGLTARPTRRLALGLAVDDLFARYEYNEDDGAFRASATDYFPVRVRGGGAYGLGDRGDGRPRATLSAEVELAVQPAEATRPGRPVLSGTSLSTPTETLELRFADVVGRGGAEVWVTDEFAVRAGLDRVGSGEAGELRPSAGFGIEQRFGELDARVDYAAVVEPFGTGIMHMATVRLGL